jgi:PhoPQ-activated pathogenicity-related protein
MVDPYSYRKRINVPTLIVNGANDAYWTVDAHTRYWNDLKQPKWILELPNSGHGLEDRSRVVSTVGAFCRSLSGLFKMPTLLTKRKFDGPEPKHVIFEVKTTESEPLSLAIWKAESDSKDFRSSKWNEQRFEKGPVIQRDITEGKFNAMFVEARFSIEGRSFTISSPVEVLYGGKQNKEIVRK